MSREPSYPKDAPVGAAAPTDGDSPPGAAGEAKGGARRTKYVAAGAAIGIGSAAIVAALLYANRKNRA